MDCIIKFMFYVLISIAITIPAAGVIAWSMDKKRSSFKDWIKNF